MSHPSQASRRLFLQQAAALGTFGAAAPMALNLAALGPAAAAGATDYKALVCVFLTGGNDAYNTVLATDTDSWNFYKAARKAGNDSISLLKDVAPDSAAVPATPAWLGGVRALQPTTTQGRSFALHPSLAQMQRLFNTDKRLAVLSNVGTLAEPVDRATYVVGKAKLPDPLFSHNDQASQWLAMAREGASQGWGGRLADAFAADNGQSLFTAVSVAGNAVWLSGKTVRQYSINPFGAIKYGFWRDANGIERIGGSVEAAAAIKRQATQPGTNHVLMKDLAAIHQASIQAEAQLSGTLPDVGAAPYGPASLLDVQLLGSGKVRNGLAHQLRMVAGMIAAAPKLGLKRQVFFVTLPGFDTHSGQNNRHTELMMQLDHGLAYFDTVLQSLGVSNQVTTFTASDFGRTFTSNGDGTDHGWGSHQFVMGGAVKGGDIHGAFPVFTAKNTQNNDFPGSPDQLYNGVLLPKQSAVQMGATLGRWFGLSGTQLADVFPTLSRFSSADLGFMKA